jgi:hypothetical protein
MIPHILHQTWKNKVIPITFSKYAESWKRFYPGWTFKLWTDAELAEFVDSRCSEFSNLFHSYPLPIMRADLGRYLLLREFGGIYADLDAEAVANAHSLLQSEVPIFAYEPQSHAALEFIQRRGFRSVVSNAVIFSPAGHAFWDRLLRRIYDCRSATNPLDATGPFILSCAIEKSTVADAPRVLPAHVFSPIDKFGAPVSRDESTLETVAAHHWAGTWWNSQALNNSLSQSTSQVTKDDFDAASMSADHFLGSINRSVLNVGISKDKGRVLVAVPFRDAIDNIDCLFESILALRYPRDDLSLVFLDADNHDETLKRFDAFAQLHAKEFRRVDVFKFDFRMQKQHSAFELQRYRQCHIAKARNQLIRRALRDEDWVLWVSAEIVGFPGDILTTLISAGGRIVNPNAVRTLGGASVDLSAWTVERRISPHAMAAWIRDGLYQPPVSFHRLYLSDLRYRDIVPLYSVGGTMLLVDADLHRAGLLFPENPYRFLIETEGFGAAACDLGVSPVGLPNVEIIHSA